MSKWEVSEKFGCLGQRVHISGIVSRLFGGFAGFDLGGIVPKSSSLCFVSHSHRDQASNNMGWASCAIVCYAKSLDGTISARAQGSLRVAS